MGTILFECPMTGSPVSTGIETEPVSFCHLSKTWLDLYCPLCGRFYGGEKCGLERAVLDGLGNRGVSRQILSPRLWGRGLARPSFKWFFPGLCPSGKAWGSPLFLGQGFRGVVGLAPFVTTNDLAFAVGYHHRAGVWGADPRPPTTQQGGWCARVGSTGNKRRPGPW